MTTKAEKLLLQILEYGLTDELKQAVHTYFQVPVFQVGDRVCFPTRYYRSGIGVIQKFINPNLVQVAWEYPGRDVRAVRNHHPKVLRIATAEDWEQIESYCRQWTEKYTR